MEITLGVILVIIFVTCRLPSAVSSVSRLSFESTTFQMLQQHPQLRMCIESVLHENEYFGCRVSELTGQCQGLTRSWGLSQTIEQGYAYAKKVAVQESFQQSPEGCAGLKLAISEVDSVWQFPVVLDTGGRIDISMSTTNWDRNQPGEVFIMFLTPTWWHREAHHWIMFRIMKTDIVILEGEGTGNFNVLGYFNSEGLPSPFHSNELFKVSLLVQPGSLAVFVEEEEVTTFNLTTHTRMMRHLSISQSPRQEVNKIFIHDIKFTVN